MNEHGERTRVLREHVEAWRDEGLIDAETRRAVEATLETMLEKGWRSHGVLVQVVFFVLTVVGMAASVGLLHLFSVPGKGIVAGIAFLAAAEYLIRAMRWFGTGVESALCIGGLFALISELPSSGKPEALLVVAAACAIAGFRVRNPLFGAAAAVLVMAYAEKRADLGVVTALVLATLAVLALLREWRRPSTEWLWIAIAMVMPVAGWFTADARWITVTIALYASFGALALVLAIVKRHHAILLAGVVGIAIASVEVAKTLSSVPLEAKLAAGGALLLALSFVLQRALRSRTTGLVVTPATLTRVDDALAIAGALAAPQGARGESVEPGRPEGRGGFGGAGATGDY